MPLINKTLLLIKLPGRGDIKNNPYVLSMNADGSWRCMVNLTCNKGKIPPGYFKWAVVLFGVRWAAPLTPPRKGRLRHIVHPDFQHALMLSIKRLRSFFSLCYNCYLKAQGSIMENPFIASSNSLPSAIFALRNEESIACIKTPLHCPGCANRP